jgi:hypothetical protein
MSRIDDLERRAFIDEIARLKKALGEASAETVLVQHQLGGLLHATEAKLRLAEHYIETLKRSRNAAEGHKHD